jgi:hypothetical protein
MISDIAHGHIDGADICFLVAAILFGVATLLRVMVRPPGERSLDAIFIAAGLTLVAIAWLIL